MPDLIAGTAVQISAPTVPKVTLVYPKTEVVLTTEQVAGPTVEIAVPVFPKAVVAPKPTGDVLVAVQVGPAGPAGPSGVPGPAGPAGGGLTGYEYVQATPAASWVVVHNLGRLPAVSVWVDGQLGLADVEALDENNLLVTFTEPTVGTASLA